MGSPAAFIVTPTLNNTDNPTTLVTSLLPKFAVAALALFPLTTFAATGDEAAVLSSGDTAWMIVATALVLFMALPGLALFYGGLVRTKNVLSVLVHCFAIAGVMSVLWVIYGYSIAFSTTGAVGGTYNLYSFIGGLDKIFLRGIGVDTVLDGGTIPESVFVTFQMTFAIITPALMVGAFAERMKFSAMLGFAVLWFTFSYLPICHMAWGGEGALFHNWGAMDFAGGTVVHVNAGVAALVACIMVGKRRGYGTVALSPHNVPFTVVGAAILWVGWFGFNAGSALAADGTAGMAMLVTQIASATGAITWMFIEWAKNGKPTAVGLATGAVAGLVAITPASGSAGPMGAILIGLASGFLCYLTATRLKQAFNYDDSLDVFGVHGVGGIVGALLTGLCAATFMGGSGMVHDTIGAQMLAQLGSIVVTMVWSGVVAAASLFLLQRTIGLRVSEDQEQQGLDLSEHGEEGYNSEA